MSSPIPDDYTTGYTYLLDDSGTRFLLDDNGINFLIADNSVFNPNYVSVAGVWIARDDSARYNQPAFNSGV